MRKILVIRLSSLGDVVLTIPVFKRLRTAFPQATIVALVKESYADVLREESSISEVIAVGRQESLLSLAQKIRNARFDGILDLHANLRSRFLCALSNAKKVTRYRKAALARRLFVMARWSHETLKEHTLERYMDALRQFAPQQSVQLTDTPSRILIIQTAFLGDAVLTTPLLDALKEQFPQSERVVLCTPAVLDVFSSHPAVTKVIPFDKKGKERSWIAKWALAKSLRTMRFDLAVIPHRSLTSALIAYFAQIPRRVGFSSSQGRFLLTDIVPFRWGEHDVERNLGLLRVFGVQNPGRDLWLKPEPETVERMNQKLQSAGVKPQDTLVGINAGSVWATKRWLPEGFAAVADRLIREKGAKVLFIGGSKDQESMRQVLSYMKEKPLNWVGETSLKELIALISRAQAFLTNDSGPMHIAVATRVPTVAIFGPTTKELGFFPYGSGHRVIEKDLSCRPCSLHGAEVCPLGHFNCMKTITADEVYNAVVEKLR